MASDPPRAQVPPGLVEEIPEAWAELVRTSSLPPPPAERRSWAALTTPTESASPEPEVGGQSGDDAYREAGLDAPASSRADGDPQPGDGPSSDDVPGAPPVTAATENPATAAPATVTSAKAADRDSADPLSNPGRRAWLASTLGFVAGVTMTVGAVGWVSGGEQPVVALPASSATTLAAATPPNPGASPRPDEPSVAGRETAGPATAEPEARVAAELAATPGRNENQPEAKSPPSEAAIPKPRPKARAATARARRPSPRSGASAAKPPAESPPAQRAFRESLTGTVLASHPASGAAAKPDPGLPATPSPLDIRRALTPLMGKIRACAGDLSGMATATLILEGTGRVGSATISGRPFASTPEGHCMEQLLLSARFPRFSRSTFRLRYPFSIRRL